MAYEYTPQFITGLFFEDNDGFPFILTQPLTYVTNVDHVGTFVVPVGFRTDLASIPRLLWFILSPVGRYDKAAVVHDFLYQTGCCTRRHADAVLREAMHVLKVRRLQRWAIYAGVRVGGWLTWSRCRRMR